MYPDIPQEFWNGFKDESNANDIVNLLIPIYSKHFEEKEIDELLKFYNTPVGKKLVEKQSLIISESQQVGAKWGEELGNKIVDKILEKYGYPDDAENP